MSRSMSTISSAPSIFTRSISALKSIFSTAAREPREKGWRRVVFRGPDGEQIELRG